MSVFLYIDPGLGTMFLQALLAGIAAIGIFFISFRNKIAGWFKKKSKTDVTDKGETDSENESS